MFFLILLIVVIAVSFALAKHSMANFQEKPDETQDYAVYLVRRKNMLDQDFLSSIHQAHRGVIFSIEKLYKGGESAVVLYAPRIVEKQFSSLDLLELEDYADKIKPANTLAWDLTQNRNPKEASYSLKFLDQIKLSLDDQVYCQIICQPYRTHRQPDCGLLFQLTMRLVVISPESEKRLNIAKRIDEQMKRLKALSRREKRTMRRIVKSYQERLLTPREVKVFLVSQEELLSLIT